ncbi:hypothetical protein [Shimia sp. SDUM112013]|uniref:hypothetical protein n=1 Tax=Shimia sp. SDUM112013 TaxID=3136160 RepID=UPI0032EDB68E
MLAGIADDDLVGGTFTDVFLTGADNDLVRLVDLIDIARGSSADTITFRDNTGSDVVTTYNRGFSQLMHDDALWLAEEGTLTAAQVVSTFGSDTGSDVQLEIGDGNIVVLMNVPSQFNLENDTTIF